MRAGAGAGRGWSRAHSPVPNWPPRAWSGRAAGAPPSSQAVLCEGRPRAKSCRAPGGGGVTGAPSREWGCPAALSGSRSNVQHISHILPVVYPSKSMGAGAPSHGQIFFATGNKNKLREVPSKSKRPCGDKVLRCSQLYM